MSEIAIFQRMPLFPVLVACAVMGLELAFQAGVRGFAGGPEAVGWRSAAIVGYSFADPLFDHMLTTRHATANGLMRFFSYGFIHLGFVHALFGSVLVLALGKATSATFSGTALVLLMVVGSVAGALTYGLALHTPVALVGIYPAVYSLIGAYTWVLFMTGQGRHARLMAFRLIALLAGLQLMFQLLIGGNSEWVAQLGGFVTGFLLSFVVAPDGRSRVRSWLAQARTR